MKRFFKWFLIIIATLILIYFLGPSPSKPTLDITPPKLPNKLAALESYIDEKEKNTRNLKEDNEARIIWNNPQKKEKTEYCVVYIHGFTASYYEGYPTNVDFAKRYGCNLYLARLSKHGLSDPDAFEKLTADKLLQSASEALAIGKKLGKKVILMCTSTGATLGLYLAAQSPENIAGIILYSPLIDFYDKNFHLLDDPWGLQIGRLITGGKYSERKDSNKAQDKYWTNKNRIEGGVELQNLVAHTMLESTFKKIKQPLFLAYYYKDKENQDKAVSVEAMLEMYKQLGTPKKLKQKQAFPKAGHHVIGSKAVSKDVKGVKQATFQFAEGVLGLRPIKK